jgi:hypothetical protein
MFKKNEKGEIISFIFVIKAGEFMGIHPSYLAKTIK